MFHEPTTCDQDTRQGLGSQEKSQTRGRMNLVIGATNYVTGALGLGSSSENRSVFPGFLLLTDGCTSEQDKPISTG